MIFDIFGLLWSEEQKPMTQEDIDQAIAEAVTEENKDDHEL